MNATLNEQAHAIVRAKARYWDLRLFSRVFADAIAAIEGDLHAAASAPRSHFVVADVDGLQQVTAWLKTSLQRLPQLQKEFERRLSAPLNAARAASDTPGGPDQIAAVSYQLALVYRDLTLLGYDLANYHCGYADGFPVLVLQEFDRVIGEVVQHLADEAQRLREMFRAFGLPALDALDIATEQAERGEAPKITAYSQTFRYRPFDASNIDRLSALIDHVADTDDGRSGFVYLLINPSMPGLVKIGHTTRATGERIRELSGATGVPTPFELIFDQFTQDSALAERQIHDRLQAYRVATNREFFAVPTSAAVKTMLAVTAAKPATLADRLAEALGG